MKDVIEIVVPVRTETNKLIRNHLVRDELAKGYEILTVVTATLEKEGPVLVYVLVREASE